MKIVAFTYECESIEEMEHSLKCGYWLKSVLNDRIYLVFSALDNCIHKYEYNEFTGRKDTVIYNIADVDSEKRKEYIEEKIYMLYRFTSEKPL